MGIRNPNFFSGEFNQPIIPKMVIPQRNPNHKAWKNFDWVIFFFSTKSSSSVRLLSSCRVIRVKIGK